MFASRTGYWEALVDRLELQAHEDTPRVLVVDDESLIRWSMTETLEHAGHSVTEAGDKKEALRRLASPPLPDVVLLDFRLPDSNDLGLLASIRRLAPAARVIMMSAFGTAEVVNGALTLGAYRVLTKPVDLHDLVPLVEQAYASSPPNAS